MANSHPGSYCGQDAYSDMLVTENGNDIHNITSGFSHEGTVGAGVRSGGNGLQRSAYDNQNWGGEELEEKTVVRRLTPGECTRLQGFPDDWVEIGDWKDSNGKMHRDADSPKYKALGNSICTPFWFWLLRRISAQYERPATLGSLFDGIGGFPLAWSKCNGPEFCLWASEIEEFPIAVTKLHFPEYEEEG